MYLKRIELKGFKSFAEKTRVDISAGITSIVGPNGSGKSNITDSIRWVLGEQSAKLLRAGKMEDIIFSGTKNRRSLGFAEVTLFIDNSSKLIPLDYKELAISRKLFRTGESEYCINENPIKLKNLRELISDTGIGKEGYSVIGQGRIDEMVSASGDQRRKIIDEACGINKYKTKRQEAQRKLESAITDLSGINIRIEELNSRLICLKTDREKALEYMRLSEKVQNAQIYDYSKKYLSKKRELSVIFEQSEVLSKRKEDAQNKIKELERLIEITEDERKQIDTKIRQYASSISDESGKLEEFRQKEILMDERANSALDLIKSIESTKMEGNSKESLLLEESKINEAALNQFNQEIDIIRNDLSLAQDKEDSEDKKLIEIDGQINSIQKEAVKILNDSLLKKERLAVNQKAIDEIIEKYDSKKKGDDGGILLKIEDLKNRLINLDSSIKQNEEESGKILQNKKSSTKTSNSLTESLYFKERQLTQTKHDFEILTRLETDLAGYERGVKSVIEADDKNIYGVVGNLFTTKEKYEIAIETAIGRNINTVVCNRARDAQKHIEYIRKNKLGRVSFLPMLEIKLRQSKNLRGIDVTKKSEGFANDLIEYDEKYSSVFEYFLGSTLIAKDYDQALGLMHLGYRIVTLEGDVLNPGGIVTGGQAKKKGGIISRKRKIEDARIAIGKLESEISKLNMQYDELGRQIKADESRLELLKNEISELMMQRLKLQYDLDNLKAQNEEEINAVKRSNLQMENLKAEQQNLIAEISFIDEENNKLECKNKELKILRDELSASRRLSADELINQKLALAQLEERLNAVNASKQRVDRELEQINKSRFGSDKEIDRLKNQVFELKKEASNARADFLRLERQIGDSKSEYENLQKLLDTLETQKASQSEQISAVRKEFEDISENLFSIETKKVRIDTQIQAIASELIVVHNIAIDAAIEKADSYTEMLTSSQIKECQSQIADLGEVNPASIAEYEVVNEKWKQINEQKEDIESSINSINNIINDVSKVINERFNEGFAKINKNFEYSFAKLFDGGQARLEIENSDDTDSGVDVVVQPPGKKLQSLSLLSGGEKALSAIALLFAIFELRPSPFCVLDEIDSSLDDVNILKFTAFLKQYSGDSQFIIITHRKGTMQIADSIYGVTMEEYGVSKLLSIQFENADI